MSPEMLVVKMQITSNMLISASNGEAASGANVYAPESDFDFDFFEEDEE